jgi:hypothetical protein
MQDSKETVTRAKYHSLLALSTLREQDALAIRLCKFDQPNRIFRPVLAIGIHDQNGIARYVIVNVAEAGTNGPLVSQVPSQPHRVYLN